MPSYDPSGWDDENQYDDSFGGFDPGEADSFSVWKPGDPELPFSHTMPERRAYRSALGDMATDLTKNYLGKTSFALGPSGFGSAYAPAYLGWAESGAYKPQGKVSLGVWGHDQGLDDPFPILGGKIITPTIDIFSSKRDRQYDESGMAYGSEEEQYRYEFNSGRTRVGQIMGTAGQRGRSMYERMIAAGSLPEEARMEADRLSRQSVRSQTASFPSEDFGQNWSWPQGLRSAMSSAVNINLHGNYGIGPKKLFELLGSAGNGYFTRATSPSEDYEHPERGAWEAYSMDSLYALGWLKGEGGSFITGTAKPDKRRQLGVQRLAMPTGADDLMRTGRLTGDRMINTTAVFMDNYAYSEGSGVSDPTLMTGFRDFRPRTIERPANAGEDWQVRFSSGGKLGFGSKLGFGNKPGAFSGAGEDISIGEQLLNGKWEPLGDETGTPGVQQRVFGWRETKAGYQALIESISPYESGTAKLMHHGMKALLFQSSAIINRMQSNVRQAIATGQLPGDVQDPRMVLPMPKDWMQNYKGMFDMLPEDTLRNMGISDKAIRSRNWQSVGPEAIDKLSAYANERKFSWQQVYEVPVERLGAFENAGNIVDGVEYLKKGGADFARFTAQHTGFALPIAAGIRIEYPGKAPMYSPEELMQMRRLYPKLAQRMGERANPASRIWGTAVAAAEGTVPQGAVAHEDLPWLTARLDDDLATMDETGGSRRLIENLAREMRTNKQMGAIVGPGGTLLPNPNDVMTQSIMGYTGQEQSQFTASYIKALKLMGTGEDATEALTAFSKNLQTFAAGHNVRRKALGATLDRAVEGTFTSHLAIPDDVVVAGNDSLRTLLGINRKDKDADAKFVEAVRMLEGGENFYALGTRRPISDMFNQLGVPTRVITEKMAQEQYGVEIENLGRSFAVSPTLAAVWRGDVDADRALLQGVTNVRYKGTEINMPGGNETWYKGGATFTTSDEIMGAFSGQTMLNRQVQALRTRAPGAYNEWLARQSSKTQGLVETGLLGGGGVEVTRAMSWALHGIDVDWNESKKWSDSLMTEEGAAKRGPKALRDITKNQPHDFAYYADPANGTTFTREQMLGKFEQTAKSKMLMGRGYNRYIRGLTSMAANEGELQASVTLASNVYQKALDNVPMSGGELLMFNLFESMGPSGAVFDKFGKEEGYVSGGSAFTGGPAGMVAVLAKAITDMGVPKEAMGQLFSRDPRIAKVIAEGGGEYEILKAIGQGGRETENAINFLENPERAGILPQLMQSLHYSKDSITPSGAAQERYAAQGRSIRDMIAVEGRTFKEDLMGDDGQTVKNAAGEAVQVSGLGAGHAAEKMRNMAGLDSLDWWRKTMAARMGFGQFMFASDEEVTRNLPSFANPALPGAEFPAYISQKEADVLEGLRQMPARHAQQIAAEVSKPAQYTPKNSFPSFDTGPEGWDKLNPSQQGELKKMFRHGATNDAIVSKMAQFFDAMQAEPVSGHAAEPPEDSSPFAAGDYDPFEGAPPPPGVDDGGNQTRTTRSGTVVETKIPKAHRVFKMGENPQQARMREAIKIMEAGEEVDISNAPQMLSFVQALGRSGSQQMEVHMNAYTNGAWSARMKFADQGLKGNAQGLLRRLVDTGMAEGRSENYYQLEQEAYAHSAIGQGMVRDVRSFMDANVETLDQKGLDKTRDSAAKIVKALGLTGIGREDKPFGDEGALGRKLEKLEKATVDLSEVQKEHLKFAKARIEADPRYQAAMNSTDALALASVSSPLKLSDQQVSSLKATQALRDMVGLPTDHIDSLLAGNQTENLLAIAGKGITSSGGIRGRLGRIGDKMLGRDADSPPIGEGSIENMFSELTLGWTAFRARMAWNLATGAQKGWMQDFMTEESSAVGAALSGGSTPGLSGSSQYISAQSAMANTRARMGEGVAQVYAPLMSSIGGVNAGPSLGAAATLAGTPFGVGSVLALGTKMLGKGFESEFLTGAAGTVGMVGAAATGAVLGTSYLSGLGEDWMKAPEDSWERTAGRAIRPGQIWAEQRGLPKIFGTLAGMGTAAVAGATEVAGPLAMLPNMTPSSIYHRIMPDSVMREFALEGTATQPGTLQGDSNKLRAWADGKYHNRVPVDSILQIAGSLMQIGGIKAEDLYSGKAPEAEAVIERYASYIEGGADPGGLYSSQVTTAGAAGVPLGPQTISFMKRFGETVPGQQRQMYEQGYQNLANIPATLGRQTTEYEVDQVTALTQQYGSEQRARQQVSSEAGVGWFTSTFGVQSGGFWAKVVGNQFGQMNIPGQDTAQQIGGMTAASFQRGGVQTKEAADMIKKFAETQPDNVLGVSNLVIQAESVSLQTGMNMADLVNKANDAGYSTRSMADQRWFFSSQAGVSGLAPSSMLSGSVQAQAFEQPYEGLSIPQQTAYRTASNMLNQVMPRGFTDTQMEYYGNMLASGTNVSDVGLSMQASQGKAGLATAFGLPAGSPGAMRLETQNIGQAVPNMSMPGVSDETMQKLQAAGGMKMTEAQVAGMRGSLNAGNFQFSTSAQIEQAAPGLAKAYMDVWNGKMSQHQYGRVQETAMGSTPWGFSSQKDFGPGSLTDSLGRPYGMYEPWTATAGRQAGQSFAPLFDMQMNAAYAGLAAQSASLPIEHRTFERQQAAQRMQWGTGPFKSFDEVQSAIFPEQGSGIEPAQVGTGMNMGESSIGLAQQEAVIRKQMWQENIAYQQQSIGFQRQSLEIAKQELELSKQQYGAQREYNLSERGANRGMQMRQREWSAEDFSIKMERMGTTQEWAMEDLQRARRYSTGRERVDIERNIQRTMVSQSWERDDSNRGRNRELEVQRFQDARYDAAVKFEQKLHELQMQRFGLQEQKLALQETMLAAQEAHLNNQAVLQGKLQEIDEARFQFQYEQVQAQMKDDEILEKLRQDVRKAEIAYQAAQLANAESLQKAQEDWLKKQEEAKDNGVLDKWIEFFDSVRAGPPGYIPPAEPTGGIDPTGGKSTEVKSTSRQIEMGVGRELSNNSQPTIVNFMLDGEVVFSAVVKPERLRPVVEEINRRGKLR